jgi:hypothetical protein
MQAPPPTGQCPPGLEAVAVERLPLRWAGHSRCPANTADRNPNSRLGTGVPKNIRATDIFPHISNESEYSFLPKPVGIGIAIDHGCLICPLQGFWCPVLLLSPSPACWPEKDSRCTWLGLSRVDLGGSSNLGSHTTKKHALCSHPCHKLGESLTGLQLLGKDFCADFSISQEYLHLSSLT